MLGRIVEISDDSRHLSLYRGFLIIRDKRNMDGELGRIPLDDILAVIAHAHGITYTNNIICEFAVRNIPFVLCNDEHETVGMLWPIEGHHQQAKRIDAQIEASKPKQKRLWSEIVKTKIQQQALLLKEKNLKYEQVNRMVNMVRSGDADNCEAQAARCYWRELFGPTFRRERNASGINALLNYGYTILRSSMSRAVISAGLHPSIGIHHSNDSNAMRLVDDLMEPFRPLVDYLVSEMIIDQEKANFFEVAPENKRRLVSCLFMTACMGDGTSTPIMVAMQRLAISLAQCYLGEKSNLDLPISFRWEFLDDSFD